MPLKHLGLERVFSLLGFLKASTALPCALRRVGVGDDIAKQKAQRGKRYRILTCEQQLGVKRAQGQKRARHGMAVLDFQEAS